MSFAKRDKLALMIADVDRAIDQLRATRARLAQWSRERISSLTCAACGSCVEYYVGLQRVNLDRCFDCGAPTGQVTGSVLDVIA